MSASQQAETVFQCIRSGAEEYLVKPVTQKEVQKIWTHVVKRNTSNPNQALPGFNPPAAAPAAAPPALPQGFGRGPAGGDAAAAAAGAGVAAALQAAQLQLGGGGPNGAAHLVLTPPPPHGDGMEADSAAVRQRQPPQQQPQQPAVFVAESSGPAAGGRADAAVNGRAPQPQQQQGRGAAAGAGAGGGSAGHPQSSMMNVRAWISRPGRKVQHAECLWVFVEVRPLGGGGWLERASR